MIGANYTPEQVADALARAAEARAARLAAEPPSDDANQHGDTEVPPDQEATTP